VDCVLSPDALIGRGAAESVGEEEQSIAARTWRAQSNLEAITINQLESLKQVIFHFLKKFGLRYSIISEGFTRILHTVGMKPSDARRQPPAPILACGGAWNARKGQCNSPSRFLLASFSGSSSTVITSILALIGEA
jgi:hypothetical protein